jgi:glycosyltransferase involved in cell wall biosynthesis
MANASSHLLVVSHPSVIAENQGVYLALAQQGWSLTLVTPAQWRDPYRPEPFPPVALEGLEESLRPLPIAFAGYDQRHVYRARVGRFVRRESPSVAFLEQEPFSLAALQWGVVLVRSKVPFGVQMDENLDRAMPVPVRVARTWVLRHAAFVAARSPDAAELAHRWGARGRVAVVPHTVPTWSGPEQLTRERVFTIGFAGRLVEEKGLLDLVAACRRMLAEFRLLIVGSGPLADQLRSLGGNGFEIEIREGVSHGDMPGVLGEMDVLVLPSRTTPQWAEQFGRILVEAMWCGVPVVGSDSGAIPWVIETTGGGLVFPEGDVGALAAALDQLAANPELRRTLADRGIRVAHAEFSCEAAASALASLLRVSDLRAP